MRADMWSFGGLLHHLLNPDKFTFEIVFETFREAHLPQPDIKRFVANTYNLDRTHPKMSDVYKPHRAEHWGILLCAYFECSVIDKEQ